MNEEMASSFVKGATDSGNKTQKCWTVNGGQPRAQAHAESLKELIEVDGSVAV